jgi:hypothetical protein
MPNRATLAVNEMFFDGLNVQRTRRDKDGGVPPLGRTMKFVVNFLAGQDGGSDRPLLLALICEHEEMQTFAPMMTSCASYRKFHHRHN